MTEYEMKVLRHLDGEDIPDLMWGAAMSEAAEELLGAGYVERVGGVYLITDAGREALAPN